MPQRNFVLKMNNYGPAKGTEGNLIYALLAKHLYNFINNNQYIL